MILIVNLSNFARYAVDQIEALLSSLGSSDSLKSPNDAAVVRASIKGWKENVCNKPINIKPDDGHTLIIKY